MLALHPLALDYTIGPFVPAGGAFVLLCVDVCSVRHTKMHANAVIV